MEELPVVLITGCSKGGIGYELCRAFATAKCRVFASARRFEAMEGLAELGIERLRLDVTSEESIKGAVDAAIQKAGRIDILVNNAGASCPGPVAEMPLSDFRGNFESNVFGVVAMVQAVVPHMVKQGSGKIVNIGSIVGYVSTPWNGTYCASKAALHSLTDTLRMELKPFGIKAVLIAPGAIRSNIAVNSAGPLAMRKWHIYVPFQGAIEERSRSSQTADSTPGDVFAAQVVQVVLQKNPPAHFTGGQLSGLFTLLRWLPLGVVDWLLSREFGLGGPSKAKVIKAE